MPRNTACAICVLAVAVFSLSALADAVVTFPDPGLEAAIRAAIGKPTGDILESDLVGITTLYANNRAISTLAGIEHCVNLQWLHLYNNQISVLAPLSALTALNWLGLYNNQISNLAPLAGLTMLKWLYLHNNQISALAPLSALTALNWLSLYNNQISNLAPLAGLTALTELDLYNNQISDLAPLAGLTALTTLRLYNNRISNLAPLAGLTALSWLILWNNQISDLAPLAGLTALSGLSLGGNQISDLAPLVLNSGIGSGDAIDVRWNNLCLDCASGKDRTDLNLLLARGASVDYEPQTACRGEDSGAVFRVDPCGDVMSDASFYGFAFEFGAADLAEWVQVTGSVEAGDVLELDPSLGQAYREAETRCSDLVAGVVSTQPGVTLGVSSLPGPQALLALSGIVPVKVTNEGGPIRPGDLLVSSSTPGYAMRWAGDGPCPCALVGKALEPFDGERGTVLVLLTAH